MVWKGCFWLCELVVMVIMRVIVNYPAGGKVEVLYKCVMLLVAVLDYPDHVWDLQPWKKLTEVLSKFYQAWVRYLSCMLTYCSISLSCSWFTCFCLPVRKSPSSSSLWKAETCVHGSVLVMSWQPPKLHSYVQVLFRCAIRPLDQALWLYDVINVIPHWVKLLECVANNPGLQCHRMVSFGVITSPHPSIGLKNCWFKKIWFFKNLNR